MNAAEWKQHLADFTGASAASFVATLFDGLVFWLLVASGLFNFGVGQFWVGVAAFAAALIGGAIHYGLSRFWVFRRFAAPLVGSAVLYIGMSWSAAVLHGALTGWWSGFLGAGWAWFASKALLWLSWTYPLSRWLIFGGVTSRATRGRDE
jgi:hypothetical protein